LTANQEKPTISRVKKANTKNNRNGSLGEILFRLRAKRQWSLNHASRAMQALGYRVSDTTLWKVERGVRVSKMTEFYVREFLSHVR